MYTRKRCIYDTQHRQIKVNFYSKLLCRLGDTVAVGNNLYCNKRNIKTALGNRIYSTNIFVCISPTIDLYTNTRTNVGFIYRFLNNLFIDSH